MNIWGITDVGAVRSHNQDSYQIQWLGKDTALVVICDGMGGANAGNVASQVAGDTFVASIKGDTVEGRPLGDLQWPRILDRAAHAANQRVYDMSMSNSSMAGMGTTLVSAVITPEQLWVVNIGDSRCYLIEDGEISQISRDHSLVEALVLRGEITPEEAKVHPKKNLITRSVGVEAAVISDVFERPNRGGYLLLCSDGLSNVLADWELRDIVLTGDQADCCRRLLQRALEAGATDNITAILVQL